MNLSQMAIIGLMGLSSLLGVKSAPVEEDGWKIIKPWTNNGEYIYLRTESSQIVDQCKSQPDGYVHFPYVMHGGHILSIDGIVFKKTGNFESNSSRSYYGVPELECSDLLLGKTLTWEIRSYSNYYSRFFSFPFVSKKKSLANFFGKTVHLAVGASLLMLGIYCYIIFRGKVSNALAGSILLSNIFLSIYFFLVVLEYIPITLTVLESHRLGTLGLWLGVIFLFRAFHEENLMTDVAWKTITTILLIGLLIILIAPDGDGVQLGGHVVFGPAMFSVLWSAVRLFKKSKRTGFTRQSVLQFLSFLVFLIASFNDIFFNLGLIDTVPLFSVGIFGGQFLFGLSVDGQIKQTYEERDYLRKNLEKEVERKTLELRNTQAELIQTAKMASLGTLSAGLAHEINNSINYVNGALVPLERLIHKSVSDGEDKNKINRLFYVMKEGVNLTIDIIKSLRNYSGLNQAKFNDLMISEVVNSVLTILKTKLSSSIKTIVRIEPDLKIFGNVAGLNQIVMNLVTNAIDAMPEGGDLIITAIREDDFMKLSCSDTGCGISEDIIPRVFDPFFTTKDVGQGTGLGLHMIKQEVNRHKGRLDVSSVLGIGTTFIVWLPISEVADNEKNIA